MLHSESDHQFAKKIRAALRHTGDLLPLTDQEVKFAERNLPTDEEAFCGLPDPRELFRKGMSACEAKKQDNELTASRSAPLQKQVDRSMAMAAREGDKISDEVRLQMLNDRKRAEREHDCNREDSEEA